MTTALTVYTANPNSSRLTSAELLVASSGAAQGSSENTSVGASTGWGELPWGALVTFAAAGSIGSPSGKGAFFDATTLVGNQLDTGNYSATLTLALSQSGKSVSCSLVVRFYKYNTSTTTYTSIGSITISSQTINSTSATAFSFPNTSLASMSFATNESLYIDAWINITSNTMTSGGTINNYYSNGTTTGWSGSSFVTPGYDPPGTTVSFTETLTVSESVIFQPDFLPSESMTDSETFAGTGNAQVTDQLTGSETFAGTGNAQATDQLTASETFAETGNFLPTDALTGQEAAAYQIGPSFQENLSASDLFAGLVEMSATDTGTNQEIFSASSHFAQSDVLTGLENGAFLLEMTATDAATLSDILNYIAYFPMNLIDVALSCSEIFAATELLSQIDALSSFIDTFQGSINYSPVESAVITENIAVTDSFSFLETGTIFENIAGTDIYLPVDTGTVQEQNQNSIETQIVDVALSAQDTPGSTPIYLPVDSIIPADGVALSNIFSGIDTGQLGDILNFGTAFFLSDLVTVTDSLALTINFIPVDLATIIDSLTVSQIDVVSFIETVSASELFQPTSLYHAYLEIWPVSETFSFAGAVQATDQINENESSFYVVQAQDSNNLNETEQLAIFCALVLSDLDSISDLLLSIPQIGATDTLTSSENSTWALSHSDQDSLNLSDLGAFLSGFQGIDIGSLSDAFASYITAYEIDQVSLLEQISPVLAMLQSDQIAISDSPTWQGAISASDVLINSENKTFVSLPALSDALSGSETAMLALSYQALDAMQPADLFSPVASLAVSDVLSTTESTSFAGSTLTIDQLSGSDLLALLVQQTMADGASLGDQYSVLQIVVTGDQLSSVLDSARYSGIFVPIEALLAQEYWNTLLSLATFDSLSLIERGPDIGVHLIDIALAPLDALAISLYEFNLVTARVYSGQVAASIYSGLVSGKVSSGIVKAIIK